MGLVAGLSALATDDPWGGVRLLSVLADAARSPDELRTVGDRLAAALRSAFRRGAAGRRVNPGDLARARYLLGAVHVALGEHDEALRLADALDAEGARTHPPEEFRVPREPAP